LTVFFTAFLLFTSPSSTISLVLLPSLSIIYTFSSSSTFYFPYFLSFYVICSLFFYLCDNVSITDWTIPSFHRLHFFRLSFSLGEWPKPTVGFAVNEIDGSWWFPVQNDSGS
jgi:hypothetical protein